MEAHAERREGGQLSTVGQVGRIPAEQAFLERGQSFQFSLPVFERRLVLIALDLLAVNTALFAGLWVSSGQNPSWILLLQHAWRFALASALWLPLGFTFDTYALGIASRFTTSAGAVLRAGFAVWTITLAFLYPAFSTGLPLAAPAAYLGSTLLFLLAGRGLYVLALVRPMFNRRALIIGAGRAGREIADAILEHENGAYQVVGFVDDDRRKLDHIIATRMTGRSATVLRVLGARGTLPELIARHRITTLVLAVTDRIDGKLLQTLMDCLESGVEIVPMPLLYEQRGRKLVRGHADRPPQHPGHTTGGQSRLRCALGRGWHALPSGSFAGDRGSNLSGLSRAHLLQAKASWQRWAHLLGL
jgi:hypothetical protein